MAPSDDQLENIPKVVSIQRLRPGSQTVVAAFQEEIVTDYFDVRFVLTERTANMTVVKTVTRTLGGLVEVENGTQQLGRRYVLSRVTGSNDAGTTLRPHPSEGMYEYAAGAGPTLGVPLLTGTPADFVPAPTSSDSMYRQYRVTITPHRRKGDSSKTFDVKIKVKNFHDGGATIRNTYISPGFGESAELAERSRDPDG